MRRWMGFSIFLWHPPDFVLVQKHKSCSNRTFFVLFNFPPFTLFGASLSQIASFRFLRDADYIILFWYQIWILKTLINTVLYCVRYNFSDFPDKGKDIYKDENNERDIAILNYCHSWSLDQGSQVHKDITDIGHSWVSW